MASERIVRYPLGKPIDSVAARSAFWLDRDGDVRGWLEPDPIPAEERARIGAGWYANEDDAAACGTTIAAIREALTREESPDA